MSLSADRVHFGAAVVRGAFNPRNRIHLLPISCRALNALRSKGIQTIGDLVAFPVEKIGVIHNVGKKTEKEILGVLRLIEDMNNEAMAAHTDGYRRAVEEARGLSRVLLDAAQERDAGCGDKISRFNLRVARSLERLAALVEAHVIEGGLVK